MSFTYQTDTATGIDTYRHFMALYGDRQTQANYFTIPAGFTGFMTVNGVGFNADALMIMGSHIDYFNFGFSNDNGALHLGFSDGTNQWAGGFWWPDLPTGGTTNGSIWRNNKIISNVAPDSSLSCEAELVSFTSDGFVLNITNAPYGDAIYIYLAMQGGNYACGTAKSPASVGPQSITGLGFRPTSIFMASGMRTDLTPTSDWARVTLGGGGRFGQWNCWAGNTAGDVFNNSVEVSGKILSLIQDDTNVGPFDPLVHCEAELASRDADGFTLDWQKTDGNEYYYSWFAVDGFSEINRWTYHHPPGSGATIPTDFNYAPKGLIFFNTEIGTESQDFDDTRGATISMGICDEDLGGQFVAGMATMDAPSFSVFRAVRIIYNGLAFGAYARVAGGLFTQMPNNMQDLGRIISVAEDIVVPIHLSRIKFRAFQEGDA